MLNLFYLNKNDNGLIVNRNVTKNANVSNIIALTFVINILNLISLKPETATKIG